MATHIVMTTIQEPTDSVRKFVNVIREQETKCIVIGDKKGPHDYPLENTDLYTLGQQLQLPYAVASQLPTGHYSRKNIGYLIAISEGASSIYETDDDNEPLDVWRPRDEWVEAEKTTFKGWVNIYDAFCNEPLWPRGFPLSKVNSNDNKFTFSGETNRYQAPIQQGLADGSPDVDAIWRLTMDRDIRFKGDQSIYLAPGSWCPFNSQSTWWWPDAYMLLYLPSYCTFRMTDIWRSFVAQRCLWEMGYGVVFHGAEVYQERNPHDLMKDFEHEIPGYLHNAEICEKLEALHLSSLPGKIGDNLYACYEMLVSEGLVGEQELVLLEAWIGDMREAMKGLNNVG